MLASIAARNPGEVLELSGAGTARLETVYGRFGRQLYGTALRLLRLPEEAEDALQDAFLAFHRAAPELTEDQAGAWLHRVVVNGCLDRLRRAKRWKSAELREETAVRGPASGFGVDLGNAVARLPEQARLIFLLHDVEGFKHREVGEILGVREGTTKSQLFRARRMLRDHMRGAS